MPFVNDVGDPFPAQVVFYRKSRIVRGLQVVFYGSDDLQRLLSKVPCKGSGQKDAR